MTEEQKDEWLFERLAGTEKLQYENRVLKLREKLINEKGSDAFLVREAQQETRKMTVTAQAYANYYEGLNHNFSLIFNQSNHVTDGAYLARQGFEWPTTVSSQSYFTILAAITAFGRLPTRPPTTAKDLRDGQLVLHPDRGGDYVEAFGGRETMDTLSRLLNASAEIVKSQLDVVDEIKLERAIEMHHRE